MTALHVFDLDGTLLRDTTASIEIAHQLGSVEAFRDLDLRFASGAVDSLGFAREAAALWSELTPEVVARAVASAPWLDGVREVLADISERGEHSLLITLSPDFFARHLHDFGMHHVHASGFPELPFGGPVDEVQAMTPADKVTATMARLELLSLGPDRCVAYGDSGSDIPLFAHLRHTVGVNATDSIRAAAARTYDGHDLRAAYALGRALLDG